MADAILEGQQGVSNEVAAEQNIDLDEKKNQKKQKQLKNNQLLNLT